MKRDSQQKLTFWENLLSIPLFLLGVVYAIIVNVIKFLRGHNDKKF